MFFFLVMAIVFTDSASVAEVVVAAVVVLVFVVLSFLLLRLLFTGGVAADLLSFRCLLYGHC